MHARYRYYYINNQAAMVLHMNREHVKAEMPYACQVNIIDLGLFFSRKIVIPSFWSQKIA